MSFFAFFAALRETSFYVTTIIQAETEADMAEARELFREYETWLGMSLCFQDFENEVASLPGKYAMPDGRLLLAHDANRLAGCIALRKREDGICEMKRLFVRGEFRGQRIGVSLIERLIADAREIGYSRMRLDTFPPKMGKAVSLYEAHGFVPIAPYYDNPNDRVLFMELTL
ncbi:MAG: GNAT family N-acetyltransferase [Pyrinomonadaceae bacterium]|nr:GNAT family N-acetyltransferase [Pyrinomonadaceae bacterium]